MSIKEPYRVNIDSLGWHAFFEERFAPFREEGLLPARVACEHRGAYVVHGEDRELLAEVSGRFLHEAQSRGDFPAVGDWVAIAPRVEEAKATIHALLPRRSAFSRKIAGPTTEEQVVAANVDTVFLVSGLDGVRNFSLRRIERYLALAWESGATPVIVLNKIDVCDDVNARVREVEGIAFGVPIHPTSATERLGLDALGQYLTQGQTAALLGSSGVGKSALINALLGGERQDVGEVREDDGRGRHTTSRRELILLPSGGIVIDTPGMREVQLWSDEDTSAGAFADIEELAAQCRFTDCVHQTEPGCAVRNAIEEGGLESARLDSYLKLQRELERLARRKDQRARQMEQEKWKKIAKWRRQMKKRE